MTPAREWSSVSFPALGSVATLLVVDPGGSPGARTALNQEARRVFDQEIEAMDRAASRFRKDSELVNLGRCGAPVVVSALLLEAIQVALRAAELTGGRVDPTVGGPMNALGYDRDFATLNRHGSALQVTFRPSPGWRTVTADPATSTVTVPPDVVLDLGATAKALCVDRAAEAIAESTGVGVLVGLGGDIAVSGPSPDGGWPVRVADNHALPDQGLRQDVLVSSGALATSGSAARRWVRGGTTLHHLVDPATGRPANEHWRTVTVAAGSCVDANIASTASFVAGPRAPGWLEKMRLPARLVRSAGEVTTVAGWPADGGRAVALEGRQGVPCS